MQNTSILWKGMHKTLNSVSYIKFVDVKFQQIDWYGLPCPYTGRICSGPYLPLGEGSLHGSNQGGREGCFRGSYEGNFGLHGGSGGVHRLHR